MKVLAHIHTFNDEEVIDETLAAIMDQTYPIPEILLVDNSSADGTLNRQFPEKVKIIRHKENLGTNGTVRTGFKYALSKGYDWIWIFDADCVPERNALEKLIQLYESFPDDIKKKTRMISSLPRDARTETPHHGIKFTPRGFEEVIPEDNAVYYECESNMWTGSLFKVEAIKKIGLPHPEYVLDWGDIEYGYQGTVQGYKAFIHQESLLKHNMHPGGGNLKEIRLGKRIIRIGFSPPIRNYYLFRNSTYFWLHEYRPRNYFFPFFFHMTVFFKMIVKTILFLDKPHQIVPHMWRGFWDGVFKKMSNRF